jgi:hypothetical protein
MLLARIYEIFPLTCNHCGGEVRLIAFVTEAVPIGEVLEHLGEPTQPTSPQRIFFSWQYGGIPLLRKSPVITNPCALKLRSPCSACGPAQTSLSGRSRLCCSPSRALVRNAGSGSGRVDGAHHGHRTFELHFRSPTLFLLHFDDCIVKMQKKLIHQNRIFD